MSRRAIYPGTFDPVTYGHIDLIKRASRIFDEVIVAVAKSTRKDVLFSVSDRVAMIKATTRDIAGVRIEVFEGLVTEYAVKRKVNVLVRGLRMFSDFEYEFQMALTNRRINETIETVFLMPSERYSFLSSSLIKEAAQLGANISTFVPEPVAKQLYRRLGKVKKK